MKGKQKLGTLPSSESKFLKDFGSFNKLSYKEQVAAASINLKAQAKDRKTPTGVTPDAAETVTLMPGVGENSGTNIQQSGRTLIAKSIEA